MMLSITLLHAFSAIPVPFDESAGGRQDSGGAAEVAWGLGVPGDLVLAALRAGCTHADAGNVLFGAGDAAGTAGALSMSDQVALLVPVVSHRHTFAWVTSPLVLHRFLRDAQASGLQVPGQVPHPGTDSTALTSYEALTKLAVSGKIILEDLDLDGRGDAAVTTWADWLAGQMFAEEEDDSEFWRAALCERLCVVDDDVLSFLADRQAHNSLSPGNRGENGHDRVGPEASAAVPPETLLWGQVTARDASIGEAAVSADDVMRMLMDLAEHPLVLGARGEGGPGLARLVVLASGG